ncbi:hypothetical protein GLOTRDRAFT_95801 [Gloeophyllum trabeum ATCC 11539]|uniref:Uncharacterized protein n=1 Tax=Gloeophyllum trabeum (strain ATCC 11539 / FP-39264 / Madison 617) TaxID=670483 RepID=S7PWZ5_GLOTA|nr:uncharacterized protein GLOTRDRAFT_95801 [Gloeophyllum trabeum ATCC 11539]EPQ52141.1 hypothetical protein GLOTRDRAFT_95801 [Gloeophyllum trabeum ATCC 11539]
MFYQTYNYTVAVGADGKIGPVTCDSWSDLTFEQFIEKREVRRDELDRRLGRDQYARVEEEEKEEGAVAAEDEAAAVEEKDETSYSYPDVTDASASFDDDSQGSCTIRQALRDLEREKLRCSVLLNDIAEEHCTLKELQQRKLRNRQTRVSASFNSEEDSQDDIPLVHVLSAIRKVQKEMDEAEDVVVLSPSMFDTSLESVAVSQVSFQEKNSRRSGGHYVKAAGGTFEDQNLPGFQIRIYRTDQDFGKEAVMVISLVTYFLKQLPSQCLVLKRSFARLSTLIYSCHGTSYVYAYAIETPTYGQSVTENISALFCGPSLHVGRMGCQLIW